MTENPETYLRSAKRRRRREAADPEPEAEQSVKKAPLITAGVHSPTAPTNRPMTPDRLLRTLRDSRLAGGWFRIE